MKKLIKVTAAVIVMLTLMSGCGSGINDPDQPPLASNSVIVADDSIPEGISPNITGVITSTCEVRDGIMILVEIPDAKNTYSENRYYVTVTGKTVIQDENKKRSESYCELTPGNTVSVWFTGTSTGTMPEYAVAQGVRITSRVEDLLMTVHHGESVIMASPTSGEVTSTDIKPLLYGSYLITDGNGNLNLCFAKTPVRIIASAVSQKNGETIFLATDSGISELELPGTLEIGDYLVTVKAEYDDSEDYYVFTLSIR